MTRVLHVLDDTCAWEQRVAITQLLGADSSDFEQHVAILGASTADADSRGPSGPVEAVHIHARSAIFAAPRVRSRLAHWAADVVHAWGPRALAAAAAARAHQPLVITVFDPGIAEDTVKLIRTICDQPAVAVVCTAERVRRRLVERGVPFDNCALVRPAIDFAMIRNVNRDAIRTALGIPSESRMLVIPPPLPRRDGHCAAMWAVLMRRYLEEPVALVVTGAGSSQAELQQLAEASGQADSVVFAGDRIPVEALVAAADDLVIGDLDEIPMTAAAWAMASNTLITAPATYATTEMLANDLNAKLFKAPPGWRQRAAKLAALLDPVTNATKLLDVARGQAYEVFSRRRFVRQMDLVYDNLLAAKLPAVGISDPALIGAA